MEVKLSTIVKNDSIITQTWKTTEFLLIVLMCTLLTRYLQFLWSRRKLYQCSWKLPGPISFPLIGSAFHLIGSPEVISSNISKMFDVYPGIFRFWIGPQIIYGLSEPEYYKILLPRYLERGSLFHNHPVVGHGLVTAPCESPQCPPKMYFEANSVLTNPYFVVNIWKRHRKVITPTFNQTILDGFMEIFSEQSQILVEQMKKLVGEGVFDAFDVISRCTVDIICETAMGVKIKSQTTNDKPVSKWIDSILESILLTSVVFIYHFDIIFNLTTLFKDYKTALKKFHHFSNSVIKEKKRLFDMARTQLKDPEDFVEGRKRKVFLEHLMDLSFDGNHFTEQELNDEVNTFIMAGSDTTAYVISCVLVMLGMHKHLQDKVYEEIIEVVGANRAVEKEDLYKLQYMERFIKETLRLFPVAGAIVRIVEEEVDLGDHVIPAGVPVMFGFLRTHTNEKYWPDPFRFDPDRFLPEEVGKRHPCAYLPFSFGPRNCIGIKYAMMSMKTILVTVIRKFRIRTPYKRVQDIKMKANVVMRFRDGYKMSLELRESQF